MSTALRKALSEVLEAKQQQGWLALFARQRLPMAGYGSRRIGKLMPNGELQFSIGATALGAEHGLNATIELIICSEGLAVLERATTSGSRSREGQYPAFQTANVDVSTVVRIVHMVEGAALQIQ